MILWNPFTRSVAAAVLGLAWLSMGNASPGASVESVAASLKALEARSGGRLGLSVREAGGREILAYRGGERFALCSTFKALLAAVVLARVDAGQEQLARPIPFGEADLLDHAPVTRKHVKEGRLSVEALCQATVEISDNTAANLLLDTLGGPAGFTRQLRAWGDATTRLDRDEPELNENAPDDPRDTTTPTAMTATLKTLLVDDALKPASRERLTAWMMASPTGAPRLRAGFPAAPPMSWESSGPRAVRRCWWRSTPAIPPSPSPRATPSLPKPPACSRPSCPLRPGRPRPGRSLELESCVDSVRVQAPRESNGPCRRHPGAMGRACSDESNAGEFHLILGACGGERFAQLTQGGGWIQKRFIAFIGNGVRKRAEFLPDMVEGARASRPDIDLVKIRDRESAPLHQPPEVQPIPRLIPPQ